MDFQANAAMLTVMAGMLLAFLFEYVPGFASWYQPLTPVRKRLLMLALLAVAAGLSMALACWSPYDIGVTCDEAGGWTLLAGFVAALGLGTASNQGTHRLIKR